MKFNAGDDYSLDPKTRSNIYITPIKISKKKPTLKSIEKTNPNRKKAIATTIRSFSISNIRTVLLVIRT